MQSTGRLQAARGMRLGYVRGSGSHRRVTGPQVALLDVDALLTSRSADRVFSSCTNELCGVRDLTPAAAGERMLNAGLLVVRPSAKAGSEAWSSAEVLSSEALSSEADYEDSVHYPSKESTTDAKRSNASREESIYGRKLKTTSI